MSILDIDDRILQLIELVDSINLQLMILKHLPNNAILELSKVDVATAKTFMYLKNSVRIAKSLSH